MKIRTVSEYIIKKEVEYGYKELEEGEHHEEMEVFDKTWRTLFNSFTEFFPEMTAIIIAKILAISLVFNVKILAFNKRILNFMKDANLIISKVETTLEIEKKRYVYVLLFLRGYAGTEYVDIFTDVKKTMRDSMKVPFDLERSAGSVIVLFG